MNHQRPELPAADTSSEGSDDVDLLQGIVASDPRTNPPEPQTAFDNGLTAEEWYAQFQLPLWLDDLENLPANFFDPSNLDSERADDDYSPVDGERADDSPWETYSDDDDYMPVSWDDWNDNFDHFLDSGIAGDASVMPLGRRAARNARRDNTAEAGAEAGADDGDDGGRDGPAFGPVPASASVFFVDERGIARPEPLPNDPRNYSERFYCFACLELKALDESRTTWWWQTVDTLCCAVSAGKKTSVHHAEIHAAGAGTASEDIAGHKTGLYSCLACAPSSTVRHDFPWPLSPKAKPRTSVVLRRLPVR
jgi:hypothetical protein